MTDNHNRRKGDGSGSKNVALAYLRVKLLLRQKLGWISILAGCLLVVLSLLIANVSFVNPMKIFWDFAMSVIFLLQLGLAVFFGSQLYPDEKNRRTLHLLLSSGISRAQWVVGNVTGIFIALFAMQILWFVITLVTSQLIFQDSYFVMALQSLVLLDIEVAIVLLLGVFLSLALRPILALAATVILTFFLHSLSSLQRIFTDPQVGRYVDDTGTKWFLLAARLLPPFEWLDLKPFIGYQAALDWPSFFGIAAAGCAWALLLAILCNLQFEKMDL